MKPFKHILAATDFSEHSDKAIQLATELAAKFQSALTLLHVYEYPASLYTESGLYSGNLVEPLLEDVEANLAEYVESIGRKIPEVGAKIRQGIPDEQILTGANEYGADLIVMGTHGRRGLARAFLGSVAEKVVRLSPIPVLTVRRAPEKRRVSSERKEPTVRGEFERSQQFGNVAPG